MYFEQDFGTYFKLTSIILMVRRKKSFGSSLYFSSVNFARDNTAIFYTGILFLPIIAQEVDKNHGFYCEKFHTCKTRRIIMAGTTANQS